MTAREREARERLEEAVAERENFVFSDRERYRAARSAHTRALRHLLRVTREEARRAE